MSGMELGKPWYLDIPKEGILCQVWDGERSYKQGIKVTVNSFDSSLDYPFGSVTKESWKYAVPTSVK